MAPEALESPEASTRPLVLVTRARSQASEPLCEALKYLGLDALHLPLIRYAPPEDAQAIPAARRALESGAVDWVAFSSPRGVDAICGPGDEPNAALGKLADWPGVAVAAVGPSTAAALAGYGRRVDLMPAVFSAPALAEAIAGRGARGRRILVPQPERARPELARGLERAGAVVLPAVVYRTLTARPSAAERAGLAALPNLAAITLASGSAARGLASLLAQRPELASTLSAARNVCIGPSTADAARRAGLRVDAVADEHSLEGLARSAAALLQEQEP